MKLADFDYYLPEELIAQEPAAKRDESRLLVLNKNDGTIRHQVFKDVINFLQPGDVLVVNNTRVIPARLYGQKEGTGAKIEVVLLKKLAPKRWETLVKPGKKARPGTKIVFGQGQLTALVVDTTLAGGRVLEFDYQGVFEEILDELGQMPLPPYITKKLADKERYQTVYSKYAGSAAAPTAGLHFTDELLQAIKDKGIILTSVLLHVGLGTFRPVKTENILEHQMHAEYYELTAETAKLINEAKKNGHRVIAVGTTTTRTLETLADEDGTINAGSGWTDIFIYPGYKFKIIDGLITNFHLPKSTLLILLSALAGRESVLAAYAVAVQEKYRFFSFGDAMLVV